MMTTEESSPLLNGRDKPEVGTKQVPFLRCAIISSVITFLVFLTSVSASPIVSQYVHAKLLNYTDNTAQPGSSSCVANSTAREDDPLTRAQKQTSDFLLLLAVTNNVPAVFVNILLGSLSDYFGRKMLFLLPALGFLIKNAMCAVIMYLKLDIKYFYIAYAIEGLGGSACAYLAVSFAYIADITSSGRGRIVATTAVELLLSLSACAGMLLTGFLIPAIGYLYLQVTMTGILMLAVLLVIFLPETRQRFKRNPWSFVTHFKNVFGFYVQKGKDHDIRTLYILTMLIFLFGVLSVLGRISIETLYGLGQPFCFDSIKIGYFGALRIGLSNAGALITLKIFQRSIRDETLALIGAIDSLISCVFEGLASTGLMLFLVPVVGIVSTTTVPIVRGAMSRMTSPDEQGAMFAGIGFVETVMNLVCQVIYTSVYSATVEVQKGAVFFLMAGFSAVTAVLVIIWIKIAPRFKYVYTIHISNEEDVAITSNSHANSSFHVSS